VGCERRLDAGARSCPAGRRRHRFVGSRLPSPQGRRPEQCSLLVRPSRQASLSGDFERGVDEHREDADRIGWLFRSAPLNHKPDAAGHLVFGFAFHSDFPISIAPKLQVKRVAQQSSQAPDIGIARSPIASAEGYGSPVQRVLGIQQESHLISPAKSQHSGG
jgi:hypothetical protein